jgi:uncharacterized protein with PQ loop repeat
LLKLFMVSRSFFVAFFRSFRYKNMPSVNMDSLTILHIHVLLFLLPTLLLWLGIPRIY